MIFPSRNKLKEMIKVKVEVGKIFEQVYESGGEMKEDDMKEGENFSSK